MRVLCVAAHPDDEVLGPGGTLLRHKAQGDEVRIWLTYLCRAESAQEAAAAEQAMGIPYECLYGETDLDSRVADFAPDIVYTHSLADLHAEHRALRERVLIACRPYAAPSVKALYAFETPSATDWGPVPFTPTRFVDIGPWLTGKLRAMAAYASELRTSPHPRNLESLTARSRYWGQVGGFAHAEPFIVVRERW